MPATTVTGRALDRLLTLLLPAPCLGCGAPLPARGFSLSLCAPCRGRLRPIPWRWGTGPGIHRGGCSRCGRPLQTADPPPAFVCQRCRDRPPPYDRAVAGWSYEPPLDTVIHGLKFRRLDYLGEELGELLADRTLIHHGDSLFAGLDAVVPVPLHWLRRRGRGYNQVELIARPLAERLGIGLKNALVRRRATAPQSGFDRKGRRRNLRGAFRGSRRYPIAGLQLLLVDDVLTTGATLEEAAACLVRNGAERVVALTVARTPGPG